MYLVDVNCDMGEGFPDDALLMPLISSANIACGAHAGNENLMQHTIELAMESGVNIGAHPGFVDPEHFGRKEMYLSPTELTDLIQSQVFLLKKFTEQAGAKLHHVKPHGALYNMSARQPDIARIIADAIKKIDPDLLLFGLSNSCSIDAAIEIQLPFYNEVFADRRYQSNGELLPRSNPHALITDTKDCCRQAEQMILHQSVTCYDGIELPLVADTLCLHGDGSTAVHLATHLYKHFQEKNIELRKN
ncbi:MAG: LamB/YcsF family protein [Sediminibacterium sp.]|nr:LamB/YcsF family protein [Sediminibacterium sp.]